MALLDRWYTGVLDRHLGEDRQMVFLIGPRQVGKTTTARAAAGVHRYMSWDRQSDRRTIVRGPDAVAGELDLRPWHRQVPKSLRKQPKLFLWDWSLVADPGARAENLVASHLLKAVQAWTDAGLGACDAFHLRDKAGREVDFLVTRDGRPWFLVEVKSSARRSLNPDLGYFQRITGAAHAFQLAFDLPYVEANAFDHTSPVRVPAATFLSQLV